ncbi:hypothetical protein TeGR_g674 [Tetraparma gracilis]|uniref:Calmodulin n=1 Tax=Tetraparma gracilis TaxID=2962635 RepID=A0ABQ6MLK5_9STRA|nr:hypothetical protein TeGR_g674 [Tetraparma gracilis]
MSSFAPSAPSLTSAPSPAAVSECVVCFDPLHAEPCCLPAASASPPRAACRHALHSRCAKQLAPRQCPVCRAPFAALLPLPPILDGAREWFDVVDVDRSGALSKAELCEALHAQFPLALDDEGWDLLWRRWDKDGSGEIEFGEIMEPATGPLAFLLSNYLRTESTPPPPLTPSTKRAFFLFYDYDSGGTLCKAEVCRALIKTFSLSSSNAKVREMTATLDGVWCVFDPDGSGEIDVEEFVAEGGLADAIIASRAYA